MPAAAAPRNGGRNGRGRQDLRLHRQPSEPTGCKALVLSERGNLPSSQYGDLMPGSREARELVVAYLEAAEREARVEAAAADPCASGAQVDNDAHLLAASLDVRLCASRAPVSSVSQRYRAYMGTNKPVATPLG